LWQNESRTTRTPFSEDTHHGHPRHRLLRDLSKAVAVLAAIVASRPESDFVKAVMKLVSIWWRLK
jgi:hypothetical protein